MSLLSQANTCSSCYCPLGLEIWLLRASLSAPRHDLGREHGSQHQELDLRDSPTHNRSFPADGYVSQWLISAGIFPVNSLVPRQGLNSDLTQLHEGILPPAEQGPLCHMMCKKMDVYRQLGSCSMAYWSGLASDSHCAREKYEALPAYSWPALRSSRGCESLASMPS